MTEPAGEHAEQATADPDHVVVRVGDTRFAIALGSLVEVLRNAPVGRLPDPPPHVVGLTSVRGYVVPVIDLGLRLLGRACEDGSRILVASPDGDDGERGHWSGRTGVRVDAIEEIVRIAGTELSEPAAELRATPASEFLQGVARIAERPVAVLRPTVLGIQRIEETDTT